MGDLRREVLLRGAASAGAVFAFLFSAWVVVQALEGSGSISQRQTVAVYVVTAVVVGSILAAIWLTLWSAYRRARP